MLVALSGCEGWKWKCEWEWEWECECGMEELVVEWWMRVRVQMRMSTGHWALGTSPPGTPSQGNKSENSLPAWERRHSHAMSSMSSMSSLSSSPGPPLLALPCPAAAQDDEGGV